VHPEFVLALRVLDAFGMPYAEAWRLLRPVAARLGIPRPSYSSVRRIVIVERKRKRENAELLDVLLADLFRGGFRRGSWNTRVWAPVGGRTPGSTDRRD
jgi:hypothetical protein